MRQDFEKPLYNSEIVVIFSYEKIYNDISCLNNRKKTNIFSVVMGKGYLIVHISKH